MLCQNRRLKIECPRAWNMSASGGSKTRGLWGVRAEATNRQQKSAASRWGNIGLSNSKFAGWEAAAEAGSRRCWGGGSSKTCDKSTKLLQGCSASHKVSYS